MSDKPNLSWRAVLRCAMPRAPTEDQEFLAYCIRIHAEEKRMLEDTIFRGASERDISGARLGVYLIALALMTYGRLDVIGDVLENMPRHPHPANRGISPTVDRLIPLPPHLRAGTSPREVLAWIRANESRLRWDENEGRFVLETA